MQRKVRILAFLCLTLPLLVALSGCREQSTAATVNGQNISMYEFERRVALARTVEELSGPVDWDTDESQRYLAQLRQNTLDNMIEELLIAEALAEAGLSIDPAELEQDLAQANADLQAEGYSGLEDYLQQLGATRAEFENMLRRSLQRELALQLVTLPDDLAQFHLRHILLLTETAAEEAAERIRQGEDWATVAEEVSTDRSSPGGDLGWLPQEILPESLAQAVSQMQPGNLQIITSEYGYHVLELLEAHQGPLHPDILGNEKLLQTLRQNYFADWLEQRREAAKIKRWIPEE
ncbi:MAG: SurA N-terminal domain-containing protein [Chloroflexia bacterium]|nr:SurA N-terminal domain-containing protein [Chloroflexia bacterium]